MEFNNRLYELRKQKGLSQEELANKVNVSRQTVSKWEIGDSTPDMEKLIALSDLFDISLDELMIGKVPAAAESVTKQSEIVNVIEEKVLTPENKVRAKKGLKIAAIVGGIVLAIDAVTMIIYFMMYGFPK